MIKKIKHLSIPICLTLLLALIYWQPQEQTQITQEPNTPSSDYYFKNVVLKQFSEKGELSSQVSAKKMEHFTTNNASTITEPKVTFISNKNSTWQLTSDQGEYSHNANQLALTGNVSISETVDTYSTLIQTENLQLDLNKKTAITHNNVQIKASNNLTHAIGMQADFHQDLIHLKAQVNTEVFSHDN